jgi:hypothetical protein
MQTACQTTGPNEEIDVKIFNIPFLMLKNIPPHTVSQSHIPLFGSNKQTDGGFAFIILNRAGGAKL